MQFRLLACLIPMLTGCAALKIPPERVNESTQAASTYEARLKRACPMLGQRIDDQSNLELQALPRRSDESARWGFYFACNAGYAILVKDRVIVDQLKGALDPRWGSIEQCSTQDDLAPERVLIGLTQGGEAEVQGDWDTYQTVKAWTIDAAKLRFTPASTKGVVCSILAECGTEDM